MTKDIIFIIFGATGDLATKKILPALENIYIQGAVTVRSRVIAVSRRDFDDAGFVQHYSQTTGRAGIPLFKNALLYTKVDIDADTGYTDLALRVVDLKRAMPQAEVVIHLSLAPNYHRKVIKALASAGILVRGESKLLIEKPFGTDEKTARELDLLLTGFVDENDIYRVDHYLGKQAAQDIMCVGEIHTGISSIHARLFEEKGIDGRGASYDGVGAFRDVGQNHMLEMLAITLANPTDGDWQAARAQVIQRLVPPENTCVDFRRGQYEGYQIEKGVTPGSETETAFRVVTMLDRIMITLESGKKMKTGEASIRIVYKNGTERVFDFRTGRDAYETVVMAALSGSKRTFVGFKEILALWNYADHVQGCWQKVPLETYSKDKPFLIQ